MKNNFKKQRGEHKYKPRIPEDQKPKLDNKKYE